MKLEKMGKERKIMLISLGIIILIFFTLIFYKKNNLNKNKDNVYFAFYSENEKVNTISEKDNQDNIVFDHGECDNGATIEWNESEWAPLVKGLTKSRTKCSLYFKKSIANLLVQCGVSGTSAVECLKNNADLTKVDLAYDDTEDNNLRYIGTNPNNYVSFNNGELWRIIGVIDGKLKIIRSASIGNMAWDSGNSDWVLSSLQDYLNNSYNISSNLSVDGNWNIGKIENQSGISRNFYNYEKNSKWTGKVGLMTASDYGYAVGGKVRLNCLNTTLDKYNTNNCGINNWLKPISGYSWTMSADSLNVHISFSVYSTGELDTDGVYNNGSIAPAIYLNENTRITGGNGTSSDPYTLEL